MRGAAAAAVIGVLASFGAAGAGPPASTPTITVAPGEVLRGRFVQERTLAGFEAPLRSEGRFALSVGRGLIWRAERPFAIVTALSPAGLVQRSGGTEVLRLSSERMPAFARMQALVRGVLIGDWRALEAQFTVRTAWNGDAWEVTLEPRAGSAAPFEQLRAWGARFAERIEIRKPRGDVDRLWFSSLTLSRDPLSEADSALLDSIAR